MGETGTEFLFRKSSSSINERVTLPQPHHPIQLGLHNTLTVEGTMGVVACELCPYSLLWSWVEPILLLGSSYVEFNLGGYKYGSLSSQLYPEIPLELTIFIIKLVSVPSSLCYRSSSAP